MVPRVPAYVFLFLLSGLLYGQSPAPAEFHISKDDARRIYALSAFAHGHRHGYEAGYRAADEEIHLGARQKDLQDKDVPKDMDYHRAFGNKKQFRQGFINGFRAGYEDSYAERAFRLPDWLESVPVLQSVSELPQSDAPPLPGREVQAQFDIGVARGYVVGQAQEASSGDATDLAKSAAGSCLSEPNAVRPGFCDGFVQGFLFGASDRIAMGSARPREASVGHVP